MIDTKYDVIFIDLDGTLIETLSGDDYPRCISDMKIKWPVWNAIRDWAKKKDNSIYIFIVTNQAGICRKYTNEDLFLIKIKYISASLYEYIGFKGEVKFDYATCKSSYKYKPGTGMFEKLTEGLDISKDKMVMIGDAISKLRGDFSDSDKKAAINFGIDYIDVDTLCRQ